FGQLWREAVSYNVGPIPQSAVHDFHVRSTSVTLNSMCFLYTQDTKNVVKCKTQIIFGDTKNFL
ncbi:MAG: hypothetical protein KH440_01835, partial [Oscillospiraceae bacterium]|nr:hypothetical protein [Oscillospiraceae bacterium]